MKRYDLMVFEEKDGTVHANMEEDVDGRYVAHQDAQSAIAAAVAEERRRVWDMMKDEMYIANVLLSYRHDYGLMNANDRFLLRLQYNEFVRAMENNDGNFREIVFSFPDGEPKTE